MIKDPAKYYNEKMLIFEKELQKTRKLIRMAGFFRLISMFIVIAGLYAGIKFNSLFAGLSSLLFLFFFISLVIWFKKLSEGKKKLEILIRIGKDEINALEGDFSSFGNGKVYLDPEHEFTYDLDIFGDKSLFQYLNRSCTKRGEQKLSSELISAPLETEDILETRAILEELSASPDFLMGYRATGMMIAEDGKEQEEILAWADREKFSVPLVVKIITLILPLVNIFLLISGLFLSGILNYMILSALSGWFLYGLYIVKINRYHATISRKQEIIAKYEGMSRILAMTEFKHERLMEAKIISQKSLAILGKLDNLINFLDARLNLLVGFILNTLFLLDFHIIYRLEDWKRKHRSDLFSLFETHSDFDVLISKSVFIFNHPRFNWPEIGDYPIQARNLGHPLLDPKIRVDNDVMPHLDEKVMIVTGANMAGKSTFLRSIGVNLILAGAGLKVCAEHMSFLPQKLVTGMRTTDSLAESESYFFAELKRLQRIVKRLEKGESCFILLDEILKGTNSTDKHKGSEALIRQLCHTRAFTVIATHDLKLGELEDLYPQKIRNYHFESTIRGEELDFDYKLRSGIAVNMNASFLMKKMGILK